MGSVLMAEAEAFRDGVRKNPEDIMEHIIVGSDYLELVSLWKNKKKHHPKIRAILDEVEERVSNFTSFQLLHTRREANFVAHLCAQHASSALASFVWSNPPSFLQHCLQFDCNNVV